MLRIIFTFGLIAAVCLVGYFLSYYKAMDFFAIVLAIVTGCYLGFGFADGRRDRLMMESVLAAVIGALILFSMWKVLWLIAAGYITHAVWCLLHYLFSIGARVPKKFALLFVVFDVGVAAFIIIRFV